MTLVRVAIAALLCAALLVVVPAQAAPLHVPARPLLPVSRLQFGVASEPSSLSWMTGSGVPWAYRYTYLAGGVNTGGGWSTWNSPAGQYATYYMDASYANGYIPVFPYYMLLQSLPHTGGDESSKDFSNLNNASTMKAYYADFKLLMLKAGAFGHPVIIHVEPDLWGYLEQRANPTGLAGNLSASVKSSGFADVAGIPNTAAGFAEALLHLRDLYAPNALLAIHASLWGGGPDVGSDTDPSLNVTAQADRTASFLNSAGLTPNPYSSTWDLVFNDVDDHDAGWWEQQGQSRWWDPTNTAFPNFTRYLSWVAEMKLKTGVPQVVWQVPEGNQYYQTMNNTCGHYQDTVAQYFIAHTSDLFSAGLIAVLFGAGNACQTTNEDSQSDGITNGPGGATVDSATTAWCNGCNTHVSTSSDDDGGYIRTFVGQYYAPVPGAPTGVTAVGGDGAVDLSWTAPGGTVTSYVITARDGCTIQGSMTVSGAPPATSTTFSNLTNGTSYTFTVAAVNSFGQGADSAASNVVVPSGSAPTWLTACTTAQKVLPNSNGSTWQDMDSTNLSLTFQPAVNSYAIITGNADLWTDHAGFNQDIAINVDGSVSPTAWKESGGFAGTFSPNAATVQTVVSLDAAHSHTVKLQWKANQPDPYSIYAGAGPIGGAFSPTRLTVQLVPATSNRVFSSVITSQPCLHYNDGTSWVDMDPGLSDNFTAPAGSWTAVITANADLFTSTPGYNQDLAINLDGTRVAWKESGGNSGTFSPNAAFVQAVVPVVAGGHTLKIQWKANHGSIGWIHSGAGPIGPDYSPTRITVVLMPNPPGGSSAAMTSQYLLSNSNGTTWQAMDATNLKLSVTPSAATSYAVSGNSDLWTSVAGYNQDLGIMVSGGAYGTGTLVAWKESGGFAGTYSPNAAFVTTDLHLASGVTYTITLVWKANRPPSAGSTIYAGAGPVASVFSPTSLTAVALSAP